MLQPAIDAIPAAAAEHAISVFRRASNKVVAYSDFLRRHQFDPESVKSISDFQYVPVTTKENYIDLYSMSELIWDSDLSNVAMIHSSSGTGGKQYHWPCAYDEIDKATGIYESVFRNEFDVGTRYKRNLLVVCFGMGTWIAGSYTNASALLLRQQGFPLTIMTPGFDRLETLRVLQKVGGSYDQVILAGIPSFMKDLLDLWKPMAPPNYPRLRILLAGEGFPESWRKQIATLIGGESTDIISLLGSADAGLIGAESSKTIKLRNSMTNDRDLARRTFGSDRIPSMMIFDPEHRFLESSTHGKLLLTCSRQLPLIRYDTGDFGGVLRKEVATFFEHQSQITDSNHETNFIVYLFGRGSKNATLYGANIYAEWIQEFLADPSISPHVTGRFCLESIWLQNFDQQLNLRIELASGISECVEMKNHWSGLLSDMLRGRSTEYARICQEYGSLAMPRIELSSYGDPEYFPIVQRKYS